MANPCAEDVSQLMHTQEQKSTWATAEILVKVSVSLLDDRVEEINLAETIGKSPGGRQTTVVDDSTAWFLPKDPFCQNDVKFRQEVYSPFRQSLHPRWLCSCEQGLGEEAQQVCVHVLPWQTAQATQGLIPGADHKGKNSFDQATSGRQGGKVQISVPGPLGCCEVTLVCFQGDGWIRWSLWPHKS